MNTNCWWADLEAQARVIVDSQCGEEGIIDHALRNIGSHHGYSVEFGAGDGRRFSNTRFLRDRGSDGLMMDCQAETDLVYKEWITAENINDLFAKYGVPKSFDVLSIDIDGMDYWVWKAIDESRFRADLVVIEFNGALAANQSITAKYDPHFKFDETTYYGASITALKNLGASKGYTLVHQHHALNLFFVLSSLLPPDTKPQIPFRPVRNFPEHHWVQVP